MKLEDYLKKIDLSISKFAYEIDITREHLSRIIHHKQRPSLSVMQRIEKATKGKVTVMEMIKLYCSDEQND